MRVIALQLATKWEDRAANHARVRQLLQQSTITPGALIVLPEMFDSGFSMNAAATDPGDTATTEAFCDGLASTLKVTLVVGTVARAAGGQLANEAVVFGPGGEIITRYRKLQPFTVVDEQRHYIRGEDVRLFNWKGLSVSPFICYDLRFPEHFRAATQQGAELLLVLANWPATRSEHWLTLLKARAIENQAYVLGVNRTGTDPNATYDGQSCLIDPLGREIFHADDREQLLSADIQSDVVRSAREAFPALRDRRS